MTRAIAILLSLMFPTGLLAETVRVKAGEFDTFTRVVLEFESRPPWNATPNGSGISIDFAVTTPLELEPLAQLATASRRTVRVDQNGPDGVSISFTCDCEATFAEFGDRALVVEITEAAPGPIDAAPPTINASMVEQPADPDVPVFEDVRPSALVGYSTASSPPVALAPAPVPDTNFALPLDRGISLLTERRPLTLEGIEFPGQRSEAVSSLSRQLARAAAQGLVDAEDAVPPSVETRVSELAENQERGNLAVTTGIDRDFLANPEQSAPSPSGATCLPEEKVNVTLWGDPTDTHTHGSLRRDMIREDGSIDPDGALQLARYYLLMGFGAEAAALSDFIVDPEEARLIRELADIVDLRPERSDYLSPQLFCDGFAGLWGLLATRPDDRSTPEDTRDILLSFSSLPAHLRQHLGPEVSQRLQSLGLVEEARNALNAVTRGGARSDESALTGARLGLTGTAPESSRETLVDLSTGTDTTSAEALLELLLDAERREMPPNPDWVYDVPSLVRATEGTRVAADLNIAGLRGMIALGEFGAFRARLTTETPGLSETSRPALANAALVASVDAGNIDFLANEIELAALISVEDMSTQDRFDIAARLFDLGLSDRALRFLAEPETADQKRIMAAILAETGRPGEAITLLEASSTDDLLRDLGKLRAAEGDTRGALNAFVEGGADDLANKLAVQRGAWDWLGDRGEPETRDVTNVLLGSAPLSTEDAEGPNGALLLETRVRRANARRLLELTETGSAPAFTN